MKFVEKIAGPDEKIIGISKIHWIYGFKGLMWLIFLSFLGFSIDYAFSRFLYGISTEVGLRVASATGHAVFFIGAAFGAVIFLLYVIMMLTAEVGLTTKRLIYKRGFIFVDVKEVDIEDIKGVDVDNGYLGRFLNYGYLMFDARFIDNLSLPAVAEPYRYVKAVNAARSRLQDKGKDDSEDFLEDNQHDKRQTQKSGGRKKDKKSSQQGKDTVEPLESDRYKALESTLMQALDGWKEETREELKRYIKDNSPAFGRVDEDSKPILFKNNPDKKKEFQEQVLEDFDESSHASQQSNH
jgi:hypothetical protein